MSGHYFDSSPDSPLETRAVDVNLPDVSLSLTAARGVFSAEHLDSGTKYLLLEAPPITSDERTILDLGCGWGPIACVTAQRAPHATVWAVDVNERARDLTGANASAIGAGERVRVAEADLVPADVTFDRILSNPPIRIGKAALHELLTRWLGRLSPSGSAQLVVQKHLGSDSLARWLQTQGYSVNRLGSRAGFRILDVRPQGEETP